MAESKNLYQITSKLEQVGYDYLYNEDTEVTLTTNKDYCIKLIVDIEDLGDSVSLIIELIWDDVNIKTKTFPKITVSNAILILTNILENIKEIDTKVHHCLDSFDTIMYPVGVGIESAVKSIKETLRSCGGRFVGGHLFRIERVGGELEVEVNEESKVVEITLYDGDSYFSNIKNNVNFDMECDLESELTSVANDYLKRLLGQQIKI